MNGLFAAYEPKLPQRGFGRAAFWHSVSGVNDGLFRACEPRPQREWTTEITEEVNLRVVRCEKVWQVVNLGALEADLGEGGPSGVLTPGWP